VSATRKRYRKR